MKPRSLYTLMAVGCAVGYVWTLYNLLLQTSADGLTPCLFRNITRLPCPACGTTRSVTALLAGDFAGALRFNPLGFVMGALLVVLPLWLLHDAWHRRPTLYRCYLRAEKWLRRKSVCVALGVLIIVNWIWNLLKY